jgi:anti-sigma factor RsiW
MTCTDCRESLNAYLDLELLPDEARDVRDHLSECADCSRAYAELEAMSTVLQRELVNYTAPDLLKARIRSALAESDARGTPRVTTSPQWLRFAAAGLMIAVISSAATYGAVRERGASRTVQDEILSSHVRSLMPGHLTDVASNNTHNVKPWFNGRVNLSPPVPRLDSAGFNLDGGRLDYVNGRPVAALVYSRRQHVINVFSWPDQGDDQDLAPVTSQGYHVVGWRSGNLAFWGVSDLNAAELGQFVTLFKAATVEATR